MRFAWLHVVCEIWKSHGCFVVAEFRRIVLLSSSGSSIQRIIVIIIIIWMHDPAGEGTSTYLNVGKYLSKDTASHRRRLESSGNINREVQIMNPLILQFCGTVCVLPSRSSLTFRSDMYVRFLVAGYTVGSSGRLKCDGTRWSMGGEVKEKLANGVGRQYSSHYLGTWCIQHYYRWCAHLSCQ